MVRVALVGNPNVGKTTIFNYLTKQCQKVANWPGKTVDIRIGTCKFGAETIQFFDLPGIYDLNPMTEDERLVIDFLTNEKFDVIVQVVDSSNLERNLYLTTLLAERFNNLVVALTMKDVISSNKTVIDSNLLANAYDIPFCWIDWSNSDTIKEFIKTVLSVSTNEKPKKKLVSIDLPEDRYSKILSLTSDAKKINNDKIQRGFFQNLTDKIDLFALHPIFGLILFFVVIFLVFYISFHVAKPLSFLIDEAWNSLTGMLLSLIFPAWVASLFEKGIFPGIGIVIIFLPQITILLLLLYGLEDFGYFPRVAVLLDKYLRDLGLSGKSVIPFLIGFSCNVPAILYTRIIYEKKSKLVTALSIPLVSCSARLPIYTILIGVFFPHNEALYLFIIYSLSLTVALVTALIFNKGLGPREDFSVLELPLYKPPRLNNLLLQTKLTVKEFLQRAGTIIVYASVLLWILSTLPYGVDYGSENSIAGLIGATISPLFHPLGFSSWQISLSLLTGVFAKEVILSSLVTTYGLNPEELIYVLEKEFDRSSALAFIVFVLFYTPCIPTIAALHSEIKSLKIVVMALVYYFVIAYLLAFMVKVFTSVVVI